MIPAIPSAHSSVIAFVSRLEAEEAALWVTALKDRLPGVRIAPLADLMPDAREAVTIAVVANPDPTEVAALKNLKWVHSVWAGVEKLVGALPSHIPLVRLIDPELSRTMAEAVLSFVYYLQRDIPAYAELQRQKVWRQLDYRPPWDVRVGLLGLGAMGMAAARRLKEAGFRVSGWSRTPRMADFTTYDGAEGLKALMAGSDIVVCLLPLTPETRGLIGREALGWLPKGAGLINFGRGPVVVTSELLAALEAGQVGHAVLDVFDEEPLPSSSPLWGHPKVMVLPHISAPTTVATASDIVAGNIARYLASGEMPETVDRARGY